MATLLALFAAPGHDQLWFLWMARQWLHGSQLYGATLFDSNPPAIVWLSAVPVLLAQALHVSAAVTGKLLVSLAAVLCLWLGGRFLRHTREALLRFEVPALLFASIVFFWVVPARDLGQRDQMLSFLVLPYVLAASVDARRYSLFGYRCLAGLLAAVGICLKPHHALLVLAVEVCVLLFPGLGAAPGCETPRWRRWLRPEPVVLAFAGLLFLASIRLFTPLYFSLALPVLHDTYWAIGHLSLPSLFLQADELCMLAALTTAAFLLRRPRSASVRVLLAAAYAAFAAYLVQGTGWYYQQIPAICLFGAALTLQLLDLLAGRLRSHPQPLRGWAVPATAALCLLALGLTAHFTGYPFTRERAFAPVLADPAVPASSFFTSLPPGTLVAILTTSVEASMMPMERYHLAWAQRTNNLWLLPAILRSESPGSAFPTHRRLPASRIAELDALQHRWMVEDLTNWKPRLVLVERCHDPAVQCQELEDRHDDLLAWFHRDPAFAAVWQRYSPAGTRGRFDAFVRSR